MSEGLRPWQRLSVRLAARFAALLIDPAALAEADRARSATSPAYRRLQATLSAVRTETLLPAPVYALADLDIARRQARIVVTSDESAAPGAPYTLAPELVQRLGWSFED